MKEEKLYRLSERVLPRFKFASDKAQVSEGQSVVLSWNVEEAEEAVFWKSTVLPSTPEPHDWWRISQLGDRVKLVDELTLTPEETTAYYLLAISPLGMRGQRILVEVVGERQPTEKPFKCDPSKLILKKMQKNPFVSLIEQPVRPPLMDELIKSQIELLTQQWSAPPTPPSITISANPEVIFEDESCILSFNISNANIADIGETETASYLLADSTKPSGTKPAGGSWGAGGSPPCKDPQCMSGNWNIVGKDHKQNNIVLWIKADNILGKTKAASKWVDILSIPKFQGSYTTSWSGFNTREAWVRDTLKFIDKKLRDGAILNDVALDQTVAAFKDGHLSRQEVWAKLLRLLQNASLVTFKCEETTNLKAVGAAWQSYSTNITLRWEPTSNWGPSEFSIAHELVHMCGFHDSLYKYYVKDDIEKQTSLVAAAIF